MTRRRRPWVGGLDTFGLTKRSLRELGPRLVTVEITIPIAPQVYPSRVRYAALLKLPPQERRRRVRQWRIEEYSRLVRELQCEKYQTVRFNLAPIGVRIKTPANQLHKLFVLRHAESVRIEAVDGRRPRRAEAAGPRLYAVKARFTFQVEGQTRGLQLCEERIHVLTAKSEADARRSAVRVLRAEESPSLLASGRFSRWHFDGILDVCEPVDHKFDLHGTEVYYEYRKRRIRRENEWHPAGKSRTKVLQRTRNKDARR